MAEGQFLSRLGCGGQVHRHRLPSRPFPAPAGLDGPQVPVTPGVYDHDRHNAPIRPHQHQGQALSHRQGQEQSGKGQGGEHQAEDSQLGLEAFQPPLYLRIRAGLKGQGSPDHDVFLKLGLVCQEEIFHGGQPKDAQPQDEISGHISPSSS